MKRYAITYNNVEGKEMLTKRWADSPAEAIMAVASQLFWDYVPKSDTEGMFAKNIRQDVPV